MEIKRELEMLMTTSRRFVLKRPGAGEAASCPVCGAAMLTAEQAAVFFGIGQREIFQLIEKETAHYTETATRSMMVCLSSIAGKLNGK